MNIAIVGTGYVGLVTGACFADTGGNVTCVDVDENKVEALKQGRVPIYEPGLDELVAKNYKAGRLKFTTSLEEVLNGQDVVFCAVGTPPDEDGSADLKYVLQVARTIGQQVFGCCDQEYGSRRHGKQNSQRHQRRAGKARGRRRV